MAILRRGRPVPLPDADIYTRPGSEPLQLNDDGEVVYVPVPLNQMQEYLMPPRNFFSIDMLYLYDVNGNVIEPGVYPRLKHGSYTETQFLDHQQRPTFHHAG